MAIPTPGPVAILVSQWCLIVLATAVIAARLYLRLRIQHRRLLSSDIIMCAAWVSAILTAVLGPIFASMGAFNPDVSTTFNGYEGDVEDLELVLKAALLAVYLQVFPEFMVKRRIFLWATIAFVATSYVITIVLLFVICLPLERNWTLDPLKSCPASAYATTFQVGWGLHFLGDLLVFILPWLIVPAFNVKRALQLGIYFTFLVGTINIAFCLVRFVTIQKAGEDYTISLSTISTAPLFSVSGSSADRHVRMTVLWSTLDMNVGLVVACLPSLRPYFGSRSNSAYPSEESHVISTPGRPSEGGSTMLKIKNFRFQRDIEESSGSTCPRTQRDPSLTYTGTTINLWEDGNRDNVSDIELLQMRLPKQ
ncbi:hypothetical protein FZEAL_3466 [Fusarium zealandicum]|uniref:Rhodopsin domain-containing protein n=1 Tax=Fusarium zealandicum TaxID=1053134 RepID=A0A8H4XMJ6_9HYPO|nr:hypothetical protein FZEAL_3466 [Fusarium zealandicum]